PPLAIAWAAAFCVDSLTCLGRLDEAEAVVTAVAEREPPAGWLHTLMYLQARGALRLAQQRPAEALDDPTVGATAGAPVRASARPSRRGGPVPQPRTPHLATPMKRPPWPANTLRSPGRAAPQPRSAPRCAGMPQRPLSMMLKRPLPRRSACWKPHPPGMSWRLRS